MVNTGDNLHFQSVRVITQIQKNPYIHFFAVFVMIAFVMVAFVMVVFSVVVFLVIVFLVVAFIEVVHCNPFPPLTIQGKA